MSKKLIKCKSCGAEIAKAEQKCPQCGATQHIGAKIACVIIIIVTIALCSAIALKECDGTEGALILIYLIVVFFLVILMAVFAPKLASMKMKGKLKFAGGLNLPANVTCKVSLSNDEIVIASSGQEFHLPAEKILSISVMKNTEIQQQYVSNVGGALAGAMIAGPLGALIGGGSSKKKIRLKRQYLVIAYQREEDVGYILFDATSNTSFVNLIKNRYYKQLKSKSSVKVDL